MNTCEPLLRDVCSLISYRSYPEALKILLDNGRLREIFSFDKNHAWYLVGDIYFKQGRFRNALNAFYKALHEYSSDADSCWAIADCYSQIGIYKIAEKYYRKSLFIRKRKEVIYDLANSIYDQKRYPEAAKLYKQLLGSGSLGIKARKNLYLAQAKITLNPSKKRL